MTDKLYLITEAQRLALIKVLNEHPELYTESSIHEAYQAMQSLPRVDSEPVAWLTQAGSLVNASLNLKTDALTYGWQPLYTSPQALTNRETAEKCAEICRSRARSISADGYNASAANEASKCALAIEHHWQTYPSKAPTPVELEELLWQYWDIGYKEGQFGKPDGDKANDVLHKIRTLFKPLQPITADDVTDEMLQQIESDWQHPNATDCTHEKFCKKAVAISYNAVIKHRGEA